MYKLREVVRAFWSGTPKQMMKVLTFRNEIPNHLSFIPSAAHLTDSVKSYFPNLFSNFFPPHFPLVKKNIARNANAVQCHN